MAVDDKHGPKLYSRLLKGLLATVRLDAPYPGRRPPSHTRKPSSRNSSLLSPGASPPSTSSTSPTRPTVTHLNISQIQAGDGRNSPGDRSVGGSPSSMQGLHVQEFFAPPLPFDGELLHSMQDLTNSTEWEGMALPGAQCPSSVVIFRKLIAPIWFPRVGLDGRVTTFWRNTPGCSATWKFRPTPNGRICDWGLFRLRFPKFLRSFCCGLSAACLAELRRDVRQEGDLRTCLLVRVTSV